VIFRRIAGVKKSSRVRWELHTVHMETKELCTEFLVGELKTREYKEDQGVDGRIILRWKWEGED
jgi:hypothetical protein